MGNGYLHHGNECDVMTGDTLKSGFDVSILHVPSYACTKLSGHMSRHMKLIYRSTI